MVLHRFPPSHKCVETTAAVILFIRCNWSMNCTRRQVLFRVYSSSTELLAAFLNTPTFFATDVVSKEFLRFAIALLMALNLDLFSASHPFSSRFI